MATSRGPGRPRASSAETIHEAALELFLEHGYDAVSVDDIARRAGVSRGTVFSYCDSKADALWVGLDAAIERAGDALVTGEGDALQRLVEAIVLAVEPWGTTPPTALRDASTMGAVEALRDGAPARLQALLDRSSLALALESDALPESTDAAVAPVAIIATACAAVVAWTRTPARGSAADAVRGAIEPIAAASRMGNDSED